MKSDSSSCIYILTNKTNKVLYIGRTTNLPERLIQHCSDFYPKSFTARYQLHKLIYFELFEDYGLACQREHQLKAGSRQNKIDLINSFNPDWRDLSNELTEGCLD